MYVVAALIKGAFPSESIPKRILAKNINPSFDGVMYEHLKRLHMGMYMLNIETFIQLHANELKKLMTEIFFLLE